MNVALLSAAVYLRCSKDRNNQASVEEQAELGVARCHAETWDPRLYDGDNDRSASRYATKERDDWERLLADLRAGLISIVWLWESSRGDRKLTEWSGFLDDCRALGVRIYVETHERLYDPRNARDWKTLAEDGVNNAYASDETSLRIRRHLAAAARKGRPHGIVPYGYMRRYDPQTGKLAAQEPSPPESDYAAEIKERIGRHEPLNSIKADLDARGIPGPDGGKWDRSTLRQIGLSPAYAGCRVLADGTLVMGWKEIVPMDVHLAAVAVLTDPSRITHRHRPGRQEHLLSYLARCGPCCILDITRPVFSPCYRRGKRMYRCAGPEHITVSADWLDELVTGLVCEALARKDAAEVWRADDTEAARLRAEAAALRLQLDEWAAAAVSPRAYEIKEQQLLPEIQRLERAAEAASVPVPLRDLIGAEDVRAEWDQLEVPAQRAVIRAMMTVTVKRPADRTKPFRTDPGRVLIDWKHGSAGRP